MTINEIKTHLSILNVLKNYGLAPNRNKMLNCPFHDDKTPSMQVYPSTNTVYCFSGNCRLHGKSLDGIEFIKEKEGCSKHEAIVKAGAMCGAVANGKRVVPKVAKVDFDELYLKFEGSVLKSEKAKGYLKSRRLSFENVGYNSGWSSKSMKNCVIYALRNRDKKVVGLYGRAVDGHGKHYYSANREGLYPGYLDGGIKRLILTESVIDAATLGQFVDDEILAMYGTNGFTSEHEALILELDLEEVILFFDGDDAGFGAVKSMIERLLKLKKSLVVSYVETPKGEDINSLAVAHEDAGSMFLELIENRILPKVEKKSVELGLDFSNANRLIYRTQNAVYQIKGGLRNDLDSLKITLETQNIESGRKLRDKLELYQFKQVENYARAVSEKIGLRSDLVEIDLYRLTDLLEDYRESERAKTEIKKVEKVSVPMNEKERCIAFLKDENLLKKLNILIGKSGIVGEEKSRLFLFIIAMSHKMENTLHAIVQGSSGSGKTHAIKKIAGLMPQEKVKCFTRVSEKGFYNFGKDEIVNFLIVLEDYDGLNEEAEFAFRELQSSGRLSSSVTVKNEKTGKMENVERIVNGPIASMVATTHGEVYEDNSSRVFMIAIDESEVQTEKIINYQNDLASGKIDVENQKDIKIFIQNMIRLLSPKKVVNPYAAMLKMPHGVKQKRRLNELFQSMVKQMTLLHQYQRKLDAKGRVISSKKDVEMAIEIMFDSIVLKVDELDGILRGFYEKLKGFVLKNGKDYEFTQREIRMEYRLSKTGCQNYFNNLLELEYISKTMVGRRNSYFYKIMYWDDLEAIRDGIKVHLNRQLKKM